MSSTSPPTSRRAGRQDHTDEVIAVKATEGEPSAPTVRNMLGGWTQAKAAAAPGHHRRGVRHRS